MVLKKLHLFYNGKHPISKVSAKEGDMALRSILQGGKKIIKNICLQVYKFTILQNYNT